VIGRGIVRAISARTHCLQPRQIASLLKLLKARHVPKEEYDVVRSLCFGLFTPIGSKSERLLFCFQQMFEPADRSLVQAAGISPPYVMFAHSMAGRLRELTRLSPMVENLGLFRRLEVWNMRWCPEYHLISRPLVSLLVLLKIRHRLSDVSQTYISRSPLDEPWGFGQSQSAFPRQETKTTKHLLVGRVLQDARPYDLSAERNEGRLTLRRIRTESFSQEDRCEATIALPGSQPRSDVRLMRP
jgi:hypothetical protein